MKHSLDDAVSKIRTMAIRNGDTPIFFSTIMRNRLDIIFTSAIGFIATFVSVDVWSTDSIEVSPIC